MPPSRPVPSPSARPAAAALALALAALPVLAEPRLAPATAALCAGSTEVWAEVLSRRQDPAAASGERLAEVLRAHALYRATVEALDAAEPGAGLEALTDHAFLEALAVWTRRREEGWKRGIDGSLTPKARNARAAHAELMRFLDWCLDRQEDFAASYLGG